MGEQRIWRQNVCLVIRGSNPTAVHMGKNENWTLGKLPAQNVPQIASRTRVENQLINAELGL